MNKSEKIKTEAKFYFEMLEDALKDAKKAQETLLGNVEETQSEHQQVKDFLEWAGLEDIFAKWRANENLHEEDQEELEFEEMFEEENLVCIIPQLKKAN